MFRKKFGIALVAALLLAACGKNAFDMLADKNSSAATKEAAQIAINNGDYATAVNMLKGQCPNNACADTNTAQMLAAAYMGGAGLNVLDLAANADANKNGGTGNNANFTTISKVLPSVTANLVQIVSAVTILSNQKTTMGLKPRAAAGTCLASYTDEQKNLLMQLGISEVSAAIIAIGSQTGGFDANGIPADCQGSCANSSALANALNAAYTPPGGNATTYAGFAAKSLVDGADSLACAFGGNAATSNSIVKTINGVAYNIETRFCSGSAPAGYQPNITGQNVIDYLQACL